MTTSTDDSIYTITIKQIETQKKEVHKIKAFDPDGALHKLDELLRHQNREPYLFKVIQVLET